MTRPPATLLREASLFLDFDGTLVELADRPDAVRVGARLKAVLADLRTQLGGRVAIISGRGAGDVEALMAERGYTIVGSHGMEFRYGDGRVVIEEPPGELAAVRAHMTRLAAAWPGVLVEDKPLGAVLHYRQRPEAADACIALAAALAEEHRLHLQTGKMMIEVRAAGADKGTALRHLMQQSPMRGTRAVFIGDDDTDEPAFAAAAEAGGAGILVGPERPSAARYRLGSVSEVLDWLEAGGRA